jgi:hypothetical protein
MHPRADCGGTQTTVIRDNGTLVGYVNVQRCPHMPSIASAILEAVRIFTARRVWPDADLVITVDRTDDGWKVSLYGTPAQR